MDQPQRLLFFISHLLFLILSTFLYHSYFVFILHLVFSYHYFLIFHVHYDQLRLPYLIMILDDFYLLYQHLDPQMFHHVCVLEDAYLIPFRSSILIKPIAERDQIKLKCSRLNNCNNQIYIWHTTELCMITDHLILIIYLLLHILILLQKSGHLILFIE